MKISDWKLALVSHELLSDDEAISTKKSLDRFLIQNNIEYIDSKVPSNFELDLIKAGKLPEDIYFRTNILKVQEYEFTDLFYVSEFTKKSDGRTTHIKFGGIDTFAEIYIDGILIEITDNMLIEYESDISYLPDGDHEILVHITPASIGSAKEDIPSYCDAQRYNLDSVVVRKAPYMYGWDIMCRAVSGGIWRDVEIIYYPDVYIRPNSVYLATLDLCERENQKYDATLSLSLTVESKKKLKKPIIKVTGVCEENVFEYSAPITGTHFKSTFTVSEIKPWWCKNYGKANLYDTKIELIDDGVIINTYSLSFGIRTATLERTSCAGEDGKFQFIINGKPVFVLGTNWVPVDPFPSKHDELTPRGLELVSDIGCNMIRCWGGNAYPGDVLYDYCDRNGIMVWQDFAMACAIYPQTEKMCSALHEEAKKVISRLRNHSSLILWSGDNECDDARNWNAKYISGKRVVLNPNDNKLTRKVLPDAIAEYDYVRYAQGLYLPSSPYLDEEAFKTSNPSENHLWGPRDYFKGEFYKYAASHFASETGYHGCPSPATLNKIITKTSLYDWGDDKVCTNAEWLVHAACMEADTSCPYAYRIPLMTRQVERLFGKKQRDILEYSLSSQISQAEAMKYFIERFRLARNKKFGIIWWNIIDGWPQISDAVVDYYGVKKLAYSYIKRSQAPFTMAFDEPDENGNITLQTINDSRDTISVSYTVSDGLSGEVLYSGNVSTTSDSNEKVLTMDENKSRFLIIKFEGDVSGINHYVCDIGNNLNYNDYVRFMEKNGFSSALEGFSVWDLLG